MDPRDVIIRPWVTEQSTAAMEQNKYTFEVAPRATKTQIKKSVEKIFGVKVVKVNTVRVHGKLKRLGRFEGRRPERKKAVVQLAEGDRIEIFEGL